jgi:hypothetical protein
MKRRIAGICGLAAMAVVSMAASCFDVTDPLVLTFNTQDLSYTSNVQQGVTSYGNPPQCRTINASDYLEDNFNVTGARIYDLSIKTNGTFAGDIQDAVVTVNGTNIVTINGPWNSFNTEQSMLTSSLITRNAAGISTLVTAVQNKQPVTLCSSGAFSAPAGAGLSLTVNLKAQVDVQPNSDNAN